MARARLPADEPDGDAIDLLAVLQALADPIRLEIVARLATSDEPISCSAFDLWVSPSTSSHHFATLRRAGLIHQYYVGTSRMNILRQEEVDERFPGVLDAVVGGAQSRQQ